MDYLPCPECTTTNAPGGAKIGNRRKECGTCNKFGARVHTRIASSLRLMYPADVERLRPQIEVAVYADMGLAAK